MMFKSILFLGCFYFLFHDFQQMKSLANNSIVTWSYFNVVPLVIMVFMIAWDTSFSSLKDKNQDFSKALYSLTAFFIWIRVIHLLKCFTHTAHLLRMASEILFRVRWLIAFIIVSLLSFGFTYFFINESREGSQLEV
jgi:hypothetical protein